jgi:hypothetical protein
MYLGLGCALENLCLAARHHGYNTEVQYETGALGLDAPATGSILVASVDLSAGEPSTDPLYIEIPNRHTNRFPYLPTELPSTLLESLNRDATNHHVRLDLFNVGDKRSEFDLLMVDSTQWIIQDAEMIHDSHRWFRNNKAEVDEHRDGSTMDAVGLPKPIAAIAKMLPPTEATKAHEMWLTATKEKHLPNAPIVGVISLKNRYDIASTLIAGRYWQRLHLMATSNGVACHPMNQPNEWIDRLAQLGETNIAEQRMARLLGTDQWQSTFSFRMGYATTAAVASPRRALTDNLI